MTDTLTVPGDRRNGNGKKWWQEVWGKVTAGLLLLAIPAALVWVWMTGKAAYAATRELYTLPPIVQAHEEQLRQLRASREMTPAQVQTLAAQIAEALAKKKPK